LHFVRGNCCTISREDKTMLSVAEGVPDKILNASILILGPESDIKTNLISVISLNIFSCSLRVHTAHCLPLPAKDDRQRIDFIAFLVDMSNLYSFQEFKTSLALVHFDYLFGKCAVIVFNHKVIKTLAFNFAELEQVARVNEIPMLFLEGSDDKNSLLVLANNLVKMIEPGIRKAQISHLVVSAATNTNV